MDKKQNVRFNMGNCSNHRNDLIKTIQKTDSFIVDIRDSIFFNNAKCMLQAEIAKEFDKEFNIILKKGVLIPQDYLVGIKKYRIFEWQTEEEYQKIFLSLLGSEKEINIEDAYST